MANTGNNKSKKKAMLIALEKSLGVVTIACRSVKVDRSTHYEWIKDDLEYAAAVKDIENVAVDFAESQLHKSIQKGSDTATIFYLKTKGKNRGYVEKTEVDNNLNFNKPLIIDWGDDEVNADTAEQ